MVRTFEALGGEILYSTRAERIITDAGKTVGVRVRGKAGSVTGTVTGTVMGTTADHTAGTVADHTADSVADHIADSAADHIADSAAYQTADSADDGMAGDQLLLADAVIVTLDTMAADSLFEEPLKAAWLDDMRRVTSPTMVTFISLGINADLRTYPGYYIFRTKNPIILDDQVYQSLSVSNYASDPDYSPPGKSALTIQLPGDTYDYWKKIREDNQYAQEKQRIAEAVIAAVTAQMPEAEGQIEAWDVATPLTYERYCGNWKGSWMTEIKPDMKFKPYPPVIRDLEGVYFAGQRMMPPGGLPAALMTARTAVQHLCRDTGTVFVSEE
jgi:phytoene dehydrogenase-like protein